MPYPQFDRSSLRMKPLAARENRKSIERDHVSPTQSPGPLSAAATDTINETVERVAEARKNARPVMLAFGAHTIKNGLAPVLIELIEEGWVTHMATNGAGIIHDWEFAYQGESSEDVRANIERGEFGNWRETGHTINLALNIGAYEGLGYGEAVGALIERETLIIPSEGELRRSINRDVEQNASQAAAAADLLSIIQTFQLEPGRLELPHRWKSLSAQAAAFRLGVPFTGHPMFGQDIIYQHPMNHGGLLGRAALRDFLTFAEGVSRIDGGIYLSVGSAVMSPMIFEKSFAMAQNLATGRGRPIERHYMLVVDLARSDWDWGRGEPPQDHPAYYLRYNKTFSRMGGTMRYLRADNRDFLLALYQALQRQGPSPG